MSAGAGRRLSAALATVTMVAGGMVAGATCAAAADPPGRIALASWWDGQTFDLLTDDAVYIHTLAEGAPDEIYRLPLTTSATGTVVGAPEQVATAVQYMSYAEHDGTLAYLQASDGRLALRAPNGDVTTPSWAETAEFGQGVRALTANWVVGGDPESVVYNLTTGAEIDLRALSHIPSGLEDSVYIDGVSLTDDRIAWAISGNSYPPGYAELLTVALDADGPTGPATSIGLVMRDAFDGSTPFAEPSVVGDAVLWLTYTANPPSPYDTHTLSWRLGAPYDAAPSTMTLPTRSSVFYAGTQLVVNTNSYLDDAYGTSQFSASWRDVSNPTVSIWSTGTITGDLQATSGSLFVYVTGEGETFWLSDASGLPVTAEGWVPPINFTDVRHGDPFATEITWLARQGVTTGYADGAFHRTDPVTRAAMAAFLYRLDNPGVAAPACTADAFADVPSTHPFCAEITWLASTGITTGWPDGTFRPSQPVSRGAMAAFLYRFANEGGTAPACTTAPFTDVATTTPFCGEIAWLASTGITTGWPDGTFRSTAAVSRQAMAAFLYRFWQAR